LLGRPSSSRAKSQEAPSNSVDLALSTHIQFATHVLDIWLTLGASVLKGIMDVAQTVDWHQHCPEGKLRSGEGDCVKPKIFVRNNAIWDSEIQLFGRDGCDISMTRLSRFESVADFATANGICSFRNWYHHQNWISNTRDHNRPREVKDKSVYAPTCQSHRPCTASLNVLRTQPHECDRSHADKDFKACTEMKASIRPIQRNVLMDASPVRAAQTWHGEWHARFCIMQGGGQASGFLNPYLPQGGTVNSARPDIRRCIEFDLCPATKFHVRGRAVEGSAHRKRGLS
jgi:hypothetical protein